MALEGFLQEFGLADILQLIYFQKKSGILNIEGKADRIKLSFINGNISESESQRRLDSNRLGKMLMKKGLISQEDLDSTIEIQQNEGIRMGAIFLKKELVSKENLREIIQEQIVETLVQIFAWKEGRYEFISQEISEDKELPVSLDTQHLLMDGLRIVDEWSLVEGKLDLNTIYKRARDPDPDELSNIEEETLDLIDEDSDVITIINLSYSGDFETSKAIISLEEKGIIEPMVVKPVEKKAGITTRKLEPPSFVAIFVIILTVLFFIFEGSINALKVFKDTRASLGIERLKTDIDIYNVTVGQYPQFLKNIAEVKDPWGRPYIYKSTEGGFTLFSSGPDGIKITDDDVY